MAQLFRKRPVLVEAVQFKGDNHQEIKIFCSKINLYGIDDDGAEYLRANPLVPTLGGNILCYPGDWIIKGVNGEFYPCDPEIFKATYDLA